VMGVGDINALVFEVWDGSERTDTPAEMTTLGRVRQLYTVAHSEQGSSRGALLQLPTFILLSVTLLYSTTQQGRTVLPTTAALADRRTRRARSR
jgi:hypothetical protein